MNTPENLVKEFIVAYQTWNDSAFKASEKNENSYMEMAGKSYQTLINTFCSSKVKPQLVAFGSDSGHSLEQEKIIRSNISENKALVITKNTDDNGFVTDHEYHLEKEQEEWKLLSLLYIDNDGKYECL